MSAPGCTECQGEPFGDCPICDGWESPLDDPTPCPEPDPRRRQGYRCVYREGHAPHPCRFEEVVCMVCGGEDARDGLCDRCASEDEAGDRLYDLEVGA